jgi:hypothetical protein
MFLSKIFTQIKIFKFYFLSFLIFLVFFLLNFNNYVGSKFLFVVYQFLSFGLFLTLFKKNNSSFEFFTYSFLLLSFWFKFNCILYFENIKVSEGDFSLEISNYDNSTKVIVIVFASCICASFLKKIFFKSLTENKFEIADPFLIFYTRYRIFFFIILTIFLTLFWLTNFYYKIYSKGLVNENISPMIQYFYSWGYTYGLSILTSLLIYIDFLIFKKKNIFILGIFEAFFSQISYYSRSFLLLFLAYSRGFFLLLRNHNKKYIISKFTTIKIIILIVPILFLSIYFVERLRNKNFYNLEEPILFLNIKKTFNEIISLSIHRWVGIDALLAVSQNNNLNFKFFLSSFKETTNIMNKSFYIDNFFTKFKYDSAEKKNLNRVITPGIVAFLYYSGSLFFVFFSMILLILICIYIEKLFYDFSMKNIILASIIGYALSMRIIHFGYVPANTLNFLFSFFVTFLFIYFVMKIVKKK